MDKELIKAYSSYWRKNRSSIESKELIFLLKGIKKAARYVFPKIKPIEWKGISVFDEGKIVLDLSFVLGEYPVPPEKVDALVGWVVHEAFHMKEMSSYVLYKAKDFSVRFSSVQREIFLEMVEAGEDIYVNYCAKGSIWELYLERAWKWYYPRLRKNKENILSILFDVWRRSFLEERFELPFGLTSLKNLYDILIGLGKEIIGVAKKKGVMEKALSRFNLYKDIWPHFYSIARNWEKSFISDIPDISQKGLGEKDDSEKGLDASIPRRDLEELKEIIASEEDITSQIKAVVQDSSKVMPTFFWEEDTPCNVEPDISIVKRLRSVFELQKQRSRYELRFVNRSLPFGKLDFRRLHKIFIDGRPFKEKEYKQANYWHIVILVDASISMSINKSKNTSSDNWYNVQKTFASLFEAAKGYQNKVQLYAYYEQAGRCFISNLLKGNRLYTLSPRGKTPSGQAIMAVAMHMLKDNRRRKLLVHITDGESNCGIDVADAIRYCERKGIHMITIGCGYKESIRDYLKSTYKDIYFMKDFSELPDAIEHLFRKRIARG